jgi:hypothetical protein
MSDTCPKFNNELFTQTLQKVQGLDLTMCDISGGRKKMKGGALTKKIIRNTIWFLIAILAGYVGVTGNHETIEVGIRMLLSGECSSLSQTIASRFYLGNPICALYTNIVTTVIKAITLDPTSVTMLIGMVTTTIGAPYAAIASVDRLVDSVATTLRIQDDGDVGRIDNGSSYSNLGIGQKFSLKGGKKQKNKKQKTKNKKTKRYTKNRKNRRYTKKR